MDTLYTDLKMFGKVKANEPLSKHTTFQIGGPARFFVTVEENEKLAGVLNYLNDNGLDYFVIGGGSNLLISDGEYDGVVVKIVSQAKPTVVAGENGSLVSAEAGVSLGALVNLASKEGLSGLEWAIGIPGTIGGAVRGNAGAMGRDISYSVNEVRIWRDGETVKLNAQECGFGYRESSFKFNKDVILSVSLLLKPGDKAEILATIQNNLKHRVGRMSTHPSAGSFFKNLKLNQWKGDVGELPELFRQRGSVPAGWLIEQVNGKGQISGGAKVSDEHGNFIVNFDNAKQEDVLKLVEEVKERVYNKFKIELEPEVQILNY